MYLLFTCPQISILQVESWEIASSKYNVLLPFNFLIKFLNFSGLIIWFLPNFLSLIISNIFCEIPVIEKVDFVKR